MGGKILKIINLDKIFSIYIIFSLITIGFMGIIIIEGLVNNGGVEAMNILYVGGSKPNNYTRIQMAINLANPGDTIFVYNGTYYESLDIDKSVNLVGENNVTTIIQGSGITDIINITANSVNVSNFTIKSEITNHINPMIKLYFCKNCKIENNNVSNNWYGIFLQSSNNNFIMNNIILNDPYINRNSIRLESSNNNIIVNNRVSHNNEGISLSSSNNNTISNNIVSNSEYGIDLYHSSLNFVLNNIVLDNWFGIYNWNSAQNTIENNTMTKSGISVRGNLLSHWNTHNINILNTVNGKPVYYLKNQSGRTLPSGIGQIILANSTNIIIKKQKISDLDIGINFGFSSWNIIENNSISNIGWSGLLFYMSSNNEIVNNDIFGCPSGIRSEFFNNNTIYNNNISSNSRAILIDSSNDNTFVNNDILSNGEGIYLTSFSDNNIIKNNNISLNEYDGLTISDSGNNTISNNFISNNDRGISITSENKNLIYHNNLINNLVQAYDVIPNQWDNDYPIGGNYWSDYLGNDINDDGIGDSPYLIDKNSQDKYPLMFPMENYPLQNNDSDSDKIPDDWELKYKFNTSDPTDAQKDPDQDDLSNLEEYFNHTDPTNPDTDGDDFKDGLEIDKDTDPLNDNDYPKDDNKESESDYFAEFRFILFFIIIILIIVIIILKLKGKKEKD